MVASLAGGLSERHWVTHLDGKTPQVVLKSDGSALAGVTELFSGSHAFCARTNSDTYCWGNNQSGVLGFPMPPGPFIVEKATVLPALATASHLAMGDVFQVATIDGNV